MSFSRFCLVYIYALEFSAKLWRIKIQNCWSLKKTGTDVWKISLHRPWWKKWKGQSKEIKEKWKGSGLWYFFLCNFFVFMTTILFLLWSLVISLWRFCFQWILRFSYYFHFFVYTTLLWLEKKSSVKNVFRMSRLWLKANVQNRIYRILLNLELFQNSLS